MAVVEIPTTDRPSLGAIRAQLGLKPIPPNPPPEMASRCIGQAWVLFESAAAHLMYALRRTVGEDLGDGAAAFAVEEHLHQWAADCKVDLAALADELVSEAADHARRP